jgi:trimethylamine---corrinoid protein Co-methyltransferase
MTNLDDQLATGQLRPRLKLLAESQLKSIHDAALHVLDKTGLSLHLPEAVNLLCDHGAKAEGKDRVRIPPAMVEEALRQVQGPVTLHNRQGEPRMYLEGLNSYYGPGPTIQFVYDVYTGERRATDREDIIRAALLCDYLPNIDFAMTMGMTGGVNPQSKGLNPAITDRHDFATMLKNTSKPLFFSCWTREGIEDVWEMAVAVKGSAELLEREPFMVLFTQPISPLLIGAHPLEQILFCAEKKIPFVFSGAPLMGSTAPNTISGSIAQSLAEVLGGLVIAQCKRPGAPFIMGTGYGPMDFRKGTSPYNGPEYYLSKLISKELCTFYNLPDWGYGGLTDAKSLDAQAAAEAALSLFHATLIGSNLVHDVGYMEMGMTACLELMVLSDELIGSFKNYLKGVKIDGESFALDIIDRIGPGGNFLAEEHTIKHLADIWHPELFDRSNYDQWAQAGKKPLESKLTEKVRWILENHSPEPLTPGVEQAINAIITRAEKKFQ